MQCSGRTIVVLLILVAASGCGKGGPPVAPVHSRVTLDGRPIENADVTFQPDGGRALRSAAPTRMAAMALHYRMGQPEPHLVGPHTVRSDLSSELVKHPPHIRARCNAGVQTVRRDVEPGQNEFNFDLKSEPK